MSKDKNSTNPMKFDPASQLNKIHVITGKMNEAGTSIDNVKICENWDEIKDILEREGFTGVDNFNDMIAHIGNMISKNDNSKSEKAKDNIAEEFPNLSIIFNKDNDLDPDHENPDEEDEYDEDDEIDNDDDDYGHYHSCAEKLESVLRSMRTSFENWIINAFEIYSKKISKKTAKKVNESIDKKFNTHFALTEAQMEESSIKLEKTVKNELNNQTNYLEHTIISSLTTIATDIKCYREEVREMNEKYNKVIDLLAHIAQSTKNKTPDNSSKESKSPSKPKHK